MIAIFNGKKIMEMKMCRMCGSYNRTKRETCWKCKWNFASDKDNWKEGQGYHHFLGIFPDWKWKWFLKMTEFYLWRLERKHQIRKLLFCSRGKHDLFPNSVKAQTSAGAPKGEMITLIDVKWKECRDCNLLFFKSIEDKDKWLAYKRNEHVAFARALQLMGKKHGQRKRKD